MFENGEVKSIHTKRSEAYACWKNFNPISHHEDTLEDKLHGTHTTNDSW